MTSFTAPSFADRWHTFSLAEQLGNIGSEVDRAIAWKKKENDAFATKAFHRSLELLDLSITDPRWKGGKRRELARVREVLCDAFAGDNLFNTPMDFLSKYFFAFALVARREKNG